MTRKFELVKGYTDKKLLPKRATIASAGYDLKAAKETVIQPIWTPALVKYLKSRFSPKWNAADIQSFLKLTNQSIKPTLVPTGICAKFPKDNVLYVFNRSSNPLKRLLILGNGTGVIDADYYPRQIYGMFFNLGTKPYIVRKYDRIMQAVFMPYLAVDNDNAKGQRRGGLGSTGK